MSASASDAAMETDRRVALLKAAGLVQYAEQRIRLADDVEDAADALAAAVRILRAACGRGQGA
jgi:hypothetical protein